MIRSGIGAVLAILFPLAAALAEEVRFTVGETRFAVDLPEGYCDVVKREDPGEVALRRRLVESAREGFDLKVVAVPCDRVDGLPERIRRGESMRMLAFIFWSPEGQTMSSDDGRSGHLRALWDGARYFARFAGKDALLELAREAAAQRDVPIKITDAELSDDHDKVGMVVSGETIAPARPQGGSLAALIEPYEGHFLLTTILGLGVVTTGKVTLKDAHELRRALRKVE